jgi:DUF1009 family protein
LPARIAEACRARGRDIFILAFEGHAARADIPADLPQAWVRLGAAGTGFRLLREAGVAEVVMAGRIRRPSLTDLRPDLRTVRFFARVGLKALGDDGLLKAVVTELETEGFRVVGVEAILPDLLVPEGVLGRTGPDDQALADIARGIEVARGIGALDVGQGAVVQQGIVLAVEAVEGTDAMLARCRTLRRDGSGGVLVKVRKPGQERRADLPTIGPATVRAAAEAGLRGIAVEAGGALIVDRTATVAAADAAGLFVVGVRLPDHLSDKD